MQALGQFIMRGRLPAAVAIGALTVLSWFLSPLAYLLSGAPVGLVTLRQGAVSGIQVIALSFLLVAGAALLLGAGVGLAAGYALGVWLPVWFAAQVLRQTESQGHMLLCAGAAGLLLVAGMRIMVPDVEAWWREWMVGWLAAHVEPAAAAQYKELVDRAAPLFNGMMGAGLTLSLAATLLLARWWQALLYNPGGFRSEFQQLCLPRWLGYALLLSLGGWWALQGAGREWLGDILIVALFTFLFQGIAAVHRTVAARKLSAAWLVAMYGLLLLMPQMILFVACLGLADSWLGARARRPPAAPGD